MTQKAKPDIWMPIYIGDYLSDTSRLTTEQHGAYFLLLMDYWKNGPPPDDDQVLAQITRLPIDAWTNARSILEPFFEVCNKQWTHKRVEKELVSAQNRKEVAVQRGIKGAEARWGKENASSNAQALVGDSSSPSPSPSSIPKPTPKRKLLAPEGVSLEVWDSFLQQRQKTRAVVTETVIKTIQKEADLAGWPLERALAEIVARGWRGFKAEWVKDKQENKLLTFAERDELAKRKKWEEMTGRRWPEPGQPAERLMIL